MRLRHRSSRATLTSLLVGALAATGASVLVASPAAAATTLTVSTTADIAANAGACGNSGTTTAPSPLSLREATCLANNIGGSVTINVPAGHYTLTNGELAVGIHQGQSVTIVGAGSASTILDGNASSRVIDLDSQLVGGIDASISDVTITNGADHDFGGAGIIGGSNHNALLDKLTLNRVAITGNHANTDNPAITDRPGGGVQFLGGQLTITDSVFSNNSSGSSYGSALAYGANGDASPESLQISGTTFSGNSTTNSAGNTGTQNGGALAVFGAASSTMSVTSSRFAGNTATSSSGSGGAVGAAIWQQSGALTVTRSTFVNNTASGGTGGNGAAIEVTSGTTDLHYNRITGNVASGGSVVHAGGSATVDATDNWWGCNTGPNTAGCESTSGLSAVSPRLVLAASASPAQVTGPNATSTVIGSFAADSDGSAVDAADLAAFSGLPMTFSDPPGDATVTTSSGSHTADVSSGAASIDYHSNTVVGPNPVNVSFDNATVTATVTANRAPAITSPNTAGFVIGQAGTFTVTTSGYPDAAISSSGTLPTGLSFVDNGDGTATLSGTPSGSGGTFPLSLTANNGAAPNATQTLTVTVGQPPSFTSPTTATFKIGQAGSFTVTTSGVPTVSTITESGTLPAGLTFTDNGDGTATLAGTPTGTGSTYPVSLTAANGMSPNGSQVLTIQVNQAPAVTANPSDQTVQPGTSVTFSAAASGVPTPTVQWQRSTDGGGSFANIGGATSTSYTFTAARSDDGNRYRAVFTNTAGVATTTAATLRVGTAPAFTSAGTGTFRVGVAGSFDVTTSGVPFATLTRTGAGFPAWLTLTDNGDGTGTLTGTPPAGSGGSYSFTLKAANGFSPAASQNFTLFVDQSPAITSADHATFTAGSAGAFAVTATAGFPTSTTLSKSGALPSGVSFVDNGDGTATLAGTPGAGSGGTYPITITASNGGTAPNTTQSFTLTVQAPPRITSADHATFAVGAAHSFTVTTAPGIPAATVLGKSGTLPSGLTFTDNGDGTATIAGTPAPGTGGVYTLSVVASNGISPNATQTFTLTVNQPPTITSADHATFVVGTASAFTVTTVNGQPASTTITESGALPAGVTFTDNGDGTATLGGTPTAGGSFPFTLTASNGVLPNATQSFTLTVNQPAQITSADHATFTVGTAGSFTVSTTPGTPAATALSSSGALPDGVTFVDNGDGSATIAGTPEVGTGGVYAVTLTADNGVNPTAIQTFYLTVRESPQISSPDHATFTAGTSGSFTVTTAGGYPTPPTVTKTGALPTGVVFLDNGDGTATIAGTPAAGTGGSYPITITAGNGVTPAATQSFTLTVDQPPTITSADHATFAVGSAGSLTVTTNAGHPAATTLTESGSLPSGVTFTDNGDGTATLAGTPAVGAGGTYPIALTASNGVPPAATQSFTLTVTATPAFTSPDHATFAIGTDREFTVATTGYPLSTITETGTLPSGLTFTDNGDGTATVGGTAATGTEGSYPLTLKADSGSEQTVQTFTLVVDKRAQTITDRSPVPSNPVVGDAYTLVATSDSGLPVSFSLAPGGASSGCTLSGTTVSLVQAGPCEVRLDQPGDGTYAAAPQVVEAFQVTRIGTSTTLDSSAPSAVYGEPVTVTATVSAGGARPAGQVQFSVDGSPLGVPVRLADGSATSPALTDGAGKPLAPGAHQVTATFVADSAAYAGSSGSVTQVVSQAATATKLTVTPTTLTAAVSVVAPGSGDPTGVVRFTVGGDEVGNAPVVGGVATLGYTVPAGQTRQVAAVYEGDTDFSASSDSLARQDPTITAKVTSAHDKTRAGWYRSAVTVTFACTPAPGADLAGPCPDPVKLTEEGAGQTVTGTVQAVDGGTATVVVSGIDIDMTPPKVKVMGVPAKPVKRGAQVKLRCVAKDPLSGVDSCTIKRTTHGTKVTFRATATDLAGNVSVEKGSYRLKPKK